jgi:hypothetical protein
MVYKYSVITLGTLFALSFPSFALAYKANDSAYGGQHVQVTHGKKTIDLEKAEPRAPGVEHRKGTHKINVSGPIASQIKKLAKDHGHIFFQWPIDDNTLFQVWTPWGYELNHVRLEHGLYQFDFFAKIHNTVYQKHGNKFPNLRSQHPKSSNLIIQYADSKFKVEQKPLHVGIAESYRRVLQRLANRGGVTFDKNMKIEKVQMPDKNDKTMIVIIDFAALGAPGRREIYGYKIMEGSKDIWQVEYSLKYLNHDGKYSPRNHEKLKQDILKELDKNRFV